MATAGESEEEEVVETRVFSPVTPAPAPPTAVPERTLPPLIYHITGTNVRRGTTLLAFLTEHTGMPAGCIRGLTALGAVYLHHTPSPRRSARASRQAGHDLSREVPGGRVYARVHAHPKRYGGAGAARVLGEAGGVVAVGKPAGVPCCAGVDNAAECVARAVGAAVTTRLDVGTSGVLLMGRGRAAVARANAGLAAGEKYYAVFCERGARVARGTWRDWYRRRAALGRGARDAPLRPWADGAAPGWVPAVMGVVDAVDVARGRVVVARLFTGRTHQIRLQMAARGVRVVGDGKYEGVVGRVYDGGVLGGDARRLGLHCWLVRCGSHWFTADVRERRDLAEFVGDWDALTRFLSAVEKRIRGGGADDMSDGSNSDGVVAT